MRDLLLVFAAYALAAGSPGPSNMRIMATAMASGRGPALVLATGVLAGSLFWGITAATGMAAILARWAWLLVALKFTGGLYLLFLGFKAGRSALQPDVERTDGTPTPPHARLFRQGLLMHLTNPKAILGWTAIMGLGLGAGATPETIAVILAGCFALGCLIFGGYAVVFSSRTAARAYGQARRWIEAALAGVFTVAGLRLLGDTVASAKAS